MNLFYVSKDLLKNMGKKDWQELNLLFSFSILSFNLD